MTNYLDDLNSAVTSALFGWDNWDAPLVNFFDHDVDTEGLVEVIRPFLERAYSDGFRHAQTGMKRVRERNPYHEYGDRAVNDPVIADQ